MMIKGTLRAKNRSIAKKLSVRRKRNKPGRIPENTPHF